MAVRTYGVVLADILALLPVNTKGISASTPLSTTHITGYIEDGAGRLTAALKRAGVDPDSLDDDTTAQVKRALEHYAVAACMAKLGRTSSSAYTEAKAAYEDALARFEASGSSLAAQPSSVKTTVDTNPVHDSRGFFTSGKSIF
jgi:hypothetical protein